MWARFTGHLPPSASQFWGGNSLAGNPCQRWLRSFRAFGGTLGRHEGEERVPHCCLRGTGGTWSG